MSPGWSVTIPVRLSSGEFEAVVAAATARGQSASEWLRLAALRELALPPAQSWGWGRASNLARRALGIVRHRGKALWPPVASTPHLRWNSEGRASTH
jgi:hypothetical protein